MEPYQDQSQQENTAPQSFNHVSLFIKLLLIVILLILTPVVLGTYRYISSNIPKPTKINNTISTPSSIQKETDIRQWINCDDIREVIEEINTLYVACMGGVLVVDKISGEIKDQISMTQGLSNRTTNSLVKDGETLYIGTQDGFTIFNLKTRQAKKISVKEGLISGSNIILAKDGNDLWVGSFEGLSLYKIDSGIIQNFTKELVDNSTKYNASRILITPDAIYAIILANAETPGGVARFDKKTQTWERFGPPAFLSKIDQYSRVDFYNLIKVGNKIYLADNQMIWEAEDKQNTTWKRLETIIPKITPQGSSIGRLMTANSKLYILANNFLYMYDESKNDVTTAYPQFSEGENILNNINSPIISTTSSNNKLWITTKPWLRWLELDSYKTGSVAFLQRPVQFGLVTTIIDDTPIVFADGQFWKYENNIFKKLPGIGENLQFDIGGFAKFQPIPNSNKIFVFTQGCGQGCSEPKIVLYNYLEDSIKLMEFPENILRHLNPDPGSSFFAELKYKEFNSSTQEFIFETSFKGQHKIIFDSKTNSFSINQISESSLTEESSFPVMCSKLFTFEKSGKTFTESSCPKELENQSYMWKYQSAYPQGKLIQIDKVTKQETELQIPVAEEDYSPFGSQNNIQINNAYYMNKKLWILTNRGLSIYDISNKNWKILTTKDGLLSNEVTNLVINNNYLWAISHWGGLSYIPIKD